MNNSQFIDKFRQKFYHMLDQKTGWGRKELKKETDRLIFSILANELQEYQDKKRINEVYEEVFEDGEVEANNEMP
jgi:hypothetical protein